MAPRKNQALLDHAMENLTVIWERQRTATHCRRGLHPWTPENTKIDGRGNRRCRECHKATTNLRRRREAEEAHGFFRPEAYWEARRGE